MLGLELEGGRRSAGEREDGVGVGPFRGLVKLELLAGRALEVVGLELGAAGHTSRERDDGAGIVCFRAVRDEEGTLMVVGSGRVLGFLTLGAAASEWAGI